MNFHFSCTGCGLCCNSAPSLSLIEAYQYSDKFFLAGSLYFNKTTPIHSPSGLDAARDRRFGAPSLEGKSGTYTLSLSATPLHDDHDMCPLLETHTFDKQEFNEQDLDEQASSSASSKASIKQNCSIYENRPTICRIVPLKQRETLRHQIDAAEDINSAKRHGWACDTSQNAGLIIENRTVVDPDMIEAHRKAETFERLDNHILSLLLSQKTKQIRDAAGLSLLEDTKTILGRNSYDIPEYGLIEMGHLLIAIKAMEARSLVKTGFKLPDVKTFCQQQIILGEAFLEKSYHTLDQNPELQDPNLAASAETAEEILRIYDNILEQI